jgi:SHAQKYF class myb-like DNA-binding protein
MSSNTAPPALLKQEEEQCGTTEIVAGQQPPQPHTMVAQPPVAQQPPPPPLSSSSSVASNPPPPTTHHHIHHQQQQQPSHNKAPPPPVQENTGRWTAEEHRLFLQGLEQHGKGWKKIASLIKSRTVVQIRTHAQKYFQKLAKARQNGEQVGGVMDGSGAGGGNGNHGQVTMATRDEGTSSSSYPQVTMRTISHHAGNGGNMSIGSDPTSLAAAAGHVGIADSGALGGRKRRAGSNPGGSTKRRAIGSVVRSSVREGRNAKRQTKAARKRKSKQQAELDGQNYVEDGAEEVDVPNPLPAISQVLDPYMPLPPPPGTLTANGPNTTGRNQLVNTATHNTLPMAALEDAVFRLLTPATGAPVPPVPTAQNNINDPLAPNTVKPPQGPSPVGVDQQLYPSWVDAKNPPAWYNDGGDIETLLEDADCLNWLTDTGDLEETYPPAVVEPSPVTSGDGANAAGSHESLSFLVDPPNQEGATTDDAATADSGTASVNPTTNTTAEADSKPAAVSTTTTTEEYSSATEAMAAVQQKQEAAVKEEPLFPDLDVGDDQEFVSALLENQGQSHLSFSKLHSELHAGDEQQQ